MAAMISSNNKGGTTTSGPSTTANAKAQSYSNQKQKSSSGAQHSSFNSRQKSGTRAKSACKGAAGKAELFNSTAPIKQFFSNLEDTVKDLAALNSTTNGAIKVVTSSNQAKPQRR